MAYTNYPEKELAREAVWDSLGKHCNVPLEERRVAILDCREAGEVMHLVNRGYKAENATLRQENDGLRNEVRRIAESEAQQTRMADALRQERERNWRTIEAEAMRNTDIMNERDALRADCAQFCGDNERLIKATGAETVDGALASIAALYAELEALECRFADSEDQRDGLLESQRDMLADLIKLDLDLKVALAKWEWMFRAGCPACGAEPGCDIDCLCCRIYAEGERGAWAAKEGV